MWVPDELQNVHLHEFMSEVRKDARAYAERRTKKDEEAQLLLLIASCYY